MSTNNAAKPSKPDNLRSLPALQRRLGVTDLGEVDAAQFQQAHELAAEGKLDLKTLARFVGKVPQAAELGLQVLRSWDRFNDSANESFQLVSDSLMNLANTLQDEGLKVRMAELQVRAHERTELTKVDVAKEGKSALIASTVITVLGGIVIALINRTGRRS